jgi:hypothetical protein
MKLNRKLWDKYQDPNERFALKCIRQDFQDANLSARDAHDYVRDEIRKERYNGLLKFGGTCGALGSVTCGLSLLLASEIANEPETLSKVLNVNAGLAVIIMVFGMFVNLSDQGYNILSPYRRGYYNEVKEVAEANR